MTQTSLNLNYTDKQIKINATFESHSATYRAIFQSYSTHNYKNGINTSRAELSEKIRIYMTELYYKYLQILNELNKRNNCHKIKNKSSVKATDDYQVQLKWTFKKDKHLKKPNKYNLKRTTHK